MLWRKGVSGAFRPGTLRAAFGTSEHLYGSIVRMTDPRQAEFEAHERKSLARGICPYSGLLLTSWGNAAAVSDLSCAVCDCFGYRKDEVGR